jgi:hypothetical protein
LERIKDIKMSNVFKNHKFDTIYYFNGFLVSYVLLKKDDAYLFKKIPNIFITEPNDYATKYIGCKIDSKDDYYKILYIERSISQPPNLQRMKVIFEKIYLKNPILYILTVANDGRSIMFINEMKFLKNYVLSEAVEYLFNHEEK